LDGYFSKNVDVKFGPTKDGCKLAGSEVLYLTTLIYLYIDVCAFWNLDHIPSDYRLIGVFLSNF